jgi:hypothetical protein
MKARDAMRKARHNLCIPLPDGRPRRSLFGCYLFALLPVNGSFVCERGVLKRGYQYKMFSER